MVALNICSSNLQCPVEPPWSSPCLQVWPRCRCFPSLKCDLLRSSWARSRSHRSPRALRVSHQPQDCRRELELGWMWRPTMAEVLGCCSEELTAGFDLLQVGLLAWAHPVWGGDSEYQYISQYLWLWYLQNSQCAVRLSVSKMIRAERLLLYHEKHYYSVSHLKTRIITICSPNNTSTMISRSCEEVIGRQGEMNRHTKKRYKCHSDKWALNE